MAYIRTTRDEYQIQSNYGSGWEEVTSEDTYKAARAQLKCYRENEPQWPHRIKKTRVKVTLLESIAAVSPDALALEFSRVLREWLGDANVADIVKENASRRAAGDMNSCASHDYCDANMVMDAALRSLGIDTNAVLAINDHDDSPERSAMFDLWNKAWTIAGDNKFSDQK